MPASAAGGFWVRWVMLLRSLRWRRTPGVAGRLVPVKKRGFETGWSRTAGEPAPSRPQELVRVMFRHRIAAPTTIAAITTYCHSRAAGRSVTSGGGAGSGTGTGGGGTWGSYAASTSDGGHADGAGNGG